MGQIKHIILLLFLLAVFDSCVKDVDFSGAYEKKVVVNCVLHSRARYYETFPDEFAFAPPIPITIEYEQQTDFDIQHLYLSYNSKDDNGSFEKVDNATAVLYDNDSGEKIGEFIRVSDYEWQLHYHIPYDVIDDTHKKYNLDYRLEITGLSDNVVTAFASLKRNVGTNFIRIVGNEDERWYSLTEDIKGPTWLTCLSFDKQTLKGMPKDTPNYFELGRVDEKWISAHYYNDEFPNKDACPYADNFNYDEASSTYARAIRLLPLAHFRGDDFTVHGRNSDNYSEMLVNFVSDDYDRFLKESIIYEMRHGDEADPTKHLYEDQVYSNINGGIGIFGIEAAYIFSQKDFSYYSHLFTDNQ